MRFILVVSFLLLGACADLTVRSPNPRIETPEAVGEAYQFKLNTGVEPAHSFQSTDKGGRRTPDFERQDVHSMYSPFLGSMFSVARRLEFGVDATPVHSGGSVHGKWQFLGAGYKEADRGNFSLAIYARAGNHRGQNSDDRDSIFDDSGSGEWNGRIDNTFVHYGLSTGYRFTKQFMAYAGFASGQQWANTKIHQDATTTDPGGDYSHRDHGLTHTAGLGGFFNWRIVQLYFTGNYCVMDYGPGVTAEDIQVSTGVYFTPWTDL